jgi:hypothetical protein
MKKPTTAVALALSGYTYALNEAPMITAAAQLSPRDTDPGFVGFISENGGCKRLPPPPPKRSLLFPTWNYTCTCMNSFTTAQPRNSSLTYSIFPDQ